MTDDIRLRESAPNLLPEQEARFEQPEQNIQPEYTPEQPSVREQRPRAEMPQVPVAEPVAEMREYSGKSELLNAIEDKLSENVKLFYWDLSEEKRELFKTKGEALARMVEQCIVTQKFQPHKVHAEVTSWLRIIGVNQWWLAQEGDILMKKIAGWVEGGAVT